MNESTGRSRSNRLSPSEQRDLQQLVCDEIARMESIIAIDGRAINDFKDLFNVCETAYNVVLLEHQRKMGKTVENKDLKLDMRQVPNALSFAGYTFDRQLLSRLFGSKSRNGWTAKEMRNSLTHGIDEEALRELKYRENDLYKDMHSFLDTLNHVG